MTMGQVVIHVEGLGKRYRLGEKLRYRTLRDSWRSLLGHRGDQVQGEDLWALNEVSFEVEQGEVVGVIGRNGAGKSTLLKILSRITRPTTGFVDIHGRVGSLLEVGTGFHPELTGRENIFLNGAILGLTRREVQAKFDDIATFAEIERFLDTPVKRYSSGMYVRLAFAVAAHLDSDILLVDEVLAVGDASFQKKCLGKMTDMTEQGRTVLFVSHQMPAVQALCKRAIWMDQGTLKQSGVVSDVLAEYFSSQTHSSSMDLGSRSDRKGNGTLKFVQVLYEDSAGAMMKSLVAGQKMKIVLLLENTSQAVLNNVRVGIGVDTTLGQRITTLASDMVHGPLEGLGTGVNRIEIDFEKTAFAPGEYLLTLFCSIGNEVSDWIQHAVNMSVEPGDYFGTGRELGPGMGVIYVPYGITLGESCR